EHARGVDRPLVEVGPALGGLEVLRHVAWFLSPGCGLCGRRDRHASARTRPARGGACRKLREATGPTFVRAAGARRLRPAGCREAGRCGGSPRVWGPSRWAAA